MRLEWDEAKRAWTRRERGLDFAHADRVFDGAEITAEDDRDDYGEIRYETTGRLDGRLVIVVWTPRGDARRIISMRRCDIDERRGYLDEMGRP